jgi:hypothetical protein
MKQKKRWLYLLIAPASLAVGTVAAQQQLPNQGQPAPMVEFYGCNFIGDNGMDDLLAVAERWNSWADRNGVADYTAVILMPVMHSEDFPFDVLWLGANPNGVSFGQGLGQWLS